MNDKPVNCDNRKQRKAMIVRQQEHLILKADSKLTGTAVFQFEGIGFNGNRAAVASRYKRHFQKILRLYKLNSRFDFVHFYLLAQDWYLLLNVNFDWNESAKPLINAIGMIYMSTE